VRERDRGVEREVERVERGKRGNKRTQHHRQSVRSRHICREHQRTSENIREHQNGKEHTHPSEYEISLNLDERAGSDVTD
jgi:hypothetical protein